MENRITVSYKNVNLKKNKYNHRSIHPHNIVYYEYFKKLKKRAAVQGNTNLVICFKKIINSIFKYPLPIKSCLEANKLIGVGKGFSYHFDRAVTQLKKNQSLQQQIKDAGASSEPLLNEHINKVIRSADLLLKDLEDSGKIPIKNKELNDEETIIHNLNILDKDMLGIEKKKKKGPNIQKSSLRKEMGESLLNSAENGNPSVNKPEKCFVFRKKEYEGFIDSLGISFHRKRKEVELNQTEIHILLVLYEGENSSEGNGMSKEQIQDELIKQGKGDLCVNYKSLHRLINMELVNKVEVLHCSVLGISKEIGTKKKLKMVNKLELSKMGKEFVSKEKEKMVQMNNISKGIIKEDHMQEVQTNDMKEKVMTENRNDVSNKDENKHFHISVYDYESRFMRDNKHSTCNEMQMNTNTYVINKNTECNIPLNEKIESEYEAFLSSKESKVSDDSGEKKRQKQNEDIIEDSICYNYSKDISNEEIENETEKLHANREESLPNKSNNNHFSLNISMAPMVSKLLKNMKGPRLIEDKSNNSFSKKEWKEIQTKNDAREVEKVIVLSELSDTGDKSEKVIQTTHRKEKRKRRSEGKINVIKKKKKTSDKEKRICNVSYGPYEIVMVIDNRDISGVHVEYYEKMKKLFDERGIKHITRNLPLGDVIWLCRRRIYEESTDLQKRTNDENPKYVFHDFYNNAKERLMDDSNDKSVKYEEYVLKWVIERKTLNDLSSSIMDGRYDEQKYRLMRMKPTSHIIYLIENSNNSFKNYTSSSKIPYESLVNAMSSIQFMTGFSILHSQNMKHTVLLLSDMHSRIVRTVRECCGFENSELNDIFPHDIRLEEYLLTEAFIWDIWFNDSKKSKNDLVKEVFGKQLRMLTNCGPDATELILSLWPTPFKLNQALNEFTHDGILANRLKKIYLRDKELGGKKVKSPINMQLIGQLRRMFAPNTLNYNN